MAMSFGSFASRVVATKVVATDGTGDFDNVQDAIDDLPAGGGAVYVKEGTYTITTAITITKSNVAVIGVAGATIIKAGNSMDDHVIHIGNDSGAFTNIFLAQFKIDGNKANQSTAKSGIYFDKHIDDITVTNVWIDSVLGDGILIDNNCDFNQITECIMRNCSGWGLHIHTTCGQNIVTLCQIRVNGGGVQFASGASNNIVQSCSITTNASIGVNLEDNFNFVYNCVIRSNTTDGILCNPSDKCIIDGNKIQGNGRYGIDVRNTTDRGIITSNQVYGNTTGQINNNGTNMVVANNQQV